MIFRYEIWQAQSMRASQLERVPTRVHMKDSAPTQCLEAVPDLRLLYPALGKARFSLTSAGPRGSLRDSAAQIRDLISPFAVFVGSEYLRCESI